MRKTFLKALAGRLEKDMAALSGPDLPTARRYALMVRRTQILKSAARMLGLSENAAAAAVRGGDMADVTGAGDVANAPLERRTIRQILRNVSTPSLEVFYGEGANAGEDIGGFGDPAERGCLLNALETNFPCVNWKSLPLESLTNNGLREIGRALMERRVQTRDELQAHVGALMRENQSGQKVTSESVLQRVRKLREEKAAGTARAKVTMPARPERPAAGAAPEEARLPQTKRYIENKPLTGLLSKELSELGFGEKAKFIMAMTPIAAEQQKLVTAEHGPERLLEGLVGDLAAMRSDPAFEKDAASRADRLRKVVSDNRTAIALLLATPEAFGKMKGGAVVTELARALRSTIPELQEALSNPWVPRNFIAAIAECKIDSMMTNSGDPQHVGDETLSKAALALVDGVSMKDAQTAVESNRRLRAVGEGEIRAFFADLLLERSAVDQDRARNPGEHLRGVLARHADALTVLLTDAAAVEKMLGEFAGPMVREAVGQIRAQALGGLQEMLRPEGLAELLPTDLPEAQRAAVLAAAAGMKPEDVLSLLLDNPATRPVANVLVVHFIGTVDASVLNQAERLIDEGVASACGDLQEMMSDQFGRLLQGSSGGRASQSPDEAEYARVIGELTNDLPEEARAEAGRLLLDEARRLGPCPGDYRRGVLEERLGVFKESRRLEASGLSPQEREDRLETFRNDLAAGRREREGQMKLDVYLQTSGLIDRIAQTYEAQDDVRTALNAIAQENSEKTVAQFSKGRDLEAVLRNRLGKYRLDGHGLNLTEGSPEAAAIRGKSLKELVGTGALDTKSGYGRFMLEVMKRYFSGVSPIDQRAMLSSLVRNGVSGDDQHAAMKNLAALFKGAGPIMQKFLQQLGSSNIDGDFRTALEDMKCNLLPIDAEVIEAQLLSIVNASNGAIRNIRVDRSLGAASIGQSLLCTITDAEGNERSVVVKLLRPDVANRMMREKDLFLAAAKEVPGMEKTYLGRLERLEEELDFRVEAKNTEGGRVYDLPLRIGERTYTDVKSMKLDPAVPVTRDVMVLERAPGKTLAGYLGDVRSELDAMPEARPGEDIIDQYERLDRLGKLKDELIAQQKKLGHLAFKWVEEGLYKGGFYHGDLHAGNIMTDPEGGLTVIDFGNATQLGEKDGKRIMRMIYGVTKNDPKLFYENFVKLMPESSQAEARRPDVARTATSILRTIFGKEIEGADSTAFQIAASLLELQKIGLTLPPAIFNFSQCQILLQGTMTELGGLITKVEDMRREIIETSNAPDNLSVTSGVHLYDDVQLFYGISRKQDSLPADMDRLAGRISPRTLAAENALQKQLQAFIDKSLPEGTDRISVDRLPPDLRAKLPFIEPGQKKVSASSIRTLNDALRQKVDNGRAFLALWSRLRSRPFMPEAAAWRALLQRAVETQSEYTVQANAINDLVELVSHMPEGHRLVALDGLPEGLADALQKARREAGGILSKTGVADAVRAFGQAHPDASAACGDVLRQLEGFPDEWCLHPVLPETLPGADQALKGVMTAGKVRRELQKLVGHCSDSSRAQQLNDLLEQLKGVPDDVYVGREPDAGMLARLGGVNGTGACPGPWVTGKALNKALSDYGNSLGDTFGRLLYDRAEDANNVAREIMSRDPEAVSCFRHFLEVEMAERTINKCGAGDHPQVFVKREDDVPSFESAMGNVVRAHKLQSAKAVGMTAALKDMLS